MVRTIISLEAEEKDWLEQRARAEGVSMAELVRRALRLLRAAGDSGAVPTEQLIEQSAGISPELEDGLALQKRLRNQW